MHLVSGWHSRGRHTPLTPPPALPVGGATRQAGEALSDLLAEANSEFFYLAMVTPRRRGTRIRRTVVNVVVFFTYRGLRGVLRIEDTT